MLAGEDDPPGNPEQERCAATDEGGRSVPDCRRDRGHLLQRFLIGLTPERKPRALHLLGMVSGLGGLTAADTKARSAEPFYVGTGSGILTAGLYACAVQPLPYGQPAARGQRSSHDYGAIWT
jgi:hypothetical protein